MPVRLDPWHKIVGVHWAGPQGQLFYMRHVKYRTGPLAAEGAFDNSRFPPTGAILRLPDGSVGPDPGFTTEGTGDRVQGGSEVIALLNSDDSGSHSVTWAQFNAPDDANPLPTDNQFVGYVQLIFTGSSYTQVKAEYDDTGNVISTLPTPR